MHALPPPLAPALALMPAALERKTAFARKESIAALLPAARVAGSVARALVVAVTSALAQAVAVTSARALVVAATVALAAAADSVALVVAVDSVAPVVAMSALALVAPVVTAERAAAPEQ
jgi:hypothetical protein